MKNRTIFLLIAGFLVMASGSFAQSVQQKISILGDSYSTFQGYVSPESNAVWYGIPENEPGNDIRKVEDTWWHQLITRQGYQLVLNNSYSGSTICHTGYNKEDYSDRSFITRMDNLGDPDLIFVFGGTNDSWAGVPLGEYQYENWSKEDLYRFRPAFCYLLAHMATQYPNAKVYHITNTELSREIADSIDKICRHYGVTNIQLQYIDKQSGHPSVNGMKQICQQVIEGLN